MLSIVFSMLLSGYCSNTASAQVAVSGSITYQTFYDNLSPYGTWIDYPGYGNVWSPQIDGDFRPYATNGYWVYSPDGWAWQSNYVWGWAPFHYGRWIYDDYYGWLWVPGYEWSPAWVTWGTVDNYYCWAPLMPDVNVSVQFGSWRPHSFYWNICSRDHIYDRNISNEMERRDRFDVNTFNRITIINNFNNTSRHNMYYSRGPETRDVEAYTHQKINPVTLRDVNKPNQVIQRGNTINIYRPTVQVPQPREFRKVEPNQVKPIRTDDQKPVTQRNEQRNNVQRLPVRNVNQNQNPRQNNPINKPVNNQTNRRGGKKNG